MYLDAIYSKEEDAVKIVGRDKNGKRFFEIKKPDYSFYYEDSNGKYKSIAGVPLSKVTANSFKTFQIEQKHFKGRNLYESDFKPVFRTLEQNYLNAELPKVHKAPVDIETGFCEERGFAPPDDPHQPITAISVGFDWLGEVVTLVLRPDSLTIDQATDIGSRFDNCYVFEDECELLKTFYDIIEDVDLLYGWNSEGFDIPYIVNRTILLLGKDYTRKLCLWDMLPKTKTFERYGKEQSTYDIFGRIHLDYFQLYKKYTYHEQPSYRLDYIGEVEIDEKKTQYDGTLDQLYKNDFEKFIEYNRQDVKLLTKLDAKLQFIQLTNVLAHQNCILFATTLGTVALTDQALILEAHSKDQRIPSREREHGSESKRIAGGYVSKPIAGLSKWIGSVDINSLYPSVIRSLNMSPETLVGQVRQDLTKAYFQNAKGTQYSGDFDEDDEDEEATADKWDGIFACLEYTEIMKKSQEIFTVDLTDQDPIQMTGEQIYDWIFASDSDFCISANGTIFRTDVDGLIPGLLAKWYSSRKEMQKKAKEFEQLVTETKDDELKLKEYKDLRDYWNQRQQAYKILLNALYGAIVNEGSRFHDQRIGQSTTLTGRTITKHMNAKINEALTGDYNVSGKCIVAADTDSCYFSVGYVEDELKEQGFELDKDSFVELANSLAETANESFPEFLEESFHITNDNKKIIKCGREICAETGLFIKKKKYAILYYDKEGFRKDVDGKRGELKIMGLDTQRADTPKTIQDFLKEVLMRVLSGETEKQVIDFIRDFRQKVKDLPSWEKGTPKRVNNLSKYRDRILKNTKAPCPGHVRASINWNLLLKMHNDNFTMPIADGQKTIFCKLKQNPMGYTSVCFPVDEFNLPKWFKELPFDDEAMEFTLIDKKLKNIIGVLNFDINASKMSQVMCDLFTFE